MEQNDIPVYLVLGFLESGKTTFVQQTLEDKRFVRDEKVLYLTCEEGEIEVDPTTFGSDNVFCQVIDEASDMTEANLSAIVKKHGITKILIEYNGMWMLNDLFNAMPENWMIAQVIVFFDSATFLNYNANMRSLVVDKIQMSDMIVFNRLTETMDPMDFHKVVRGLSRQTSIVYEKVTGEIAYDEIEDPLPFDKDAEVIDIEDKDFALFYRDISEKPGDYDGKTIRFTALVANDNKLGCGQMFVGRHIMTCCVEDIQYHAMVCKWPKSEDFKSYDWVKVTADVKIAKHKAYQSEGPVLTAKSVERWKEPDPPVATFY